jgi:outer membrane protein assembly factor BamB
MLADDGTLTCLDPQTGNEIWREHVAGTFYASPIAADGRIYLISKQGKAVVIKAGRTFEPLATNVLDIGMMASPAVDGKALILRTLTHLYRIEE